MTTYYVDNTITPASCTTYNPTTRLCSGGTATAYKNLKEAADILAAGDILKIQPGTYSGTDVAYNGINANNIVIEGNGTFASDVMLDMTTTHSSGFMYNSGKTGVIFRNFTIGTQGAAGSLLFNLVTGSATTFENIIFIEYNKSAISLNASTATIKNCKFLGVKVPSLVTGAVILSAASNVNIYNSIFSGSANYRSSPIYIADSGSTMNLYNSIVTESKLYGINLAAAAVVNIRNCGFWGNGIESISGSYNIFGACANVSFDYSLALPNMSYVRNLDSEIIAGNNCPAQQMPRIQYPGKKSFVSIVIDDSAAVTNRNALNAAKAATESIGSHATWVIDVKSWIETYSTNETYSNYIKNWINNGHDVGIHSYSHTDMTVITGAITCNYSGIGDNTVVVAIINPTSINYSDWSGTLTLSGSLVLNLKSGDNFLSLNDIKTWVDAQTDWTATVSNYGSGYVSPNSVGMALEAVSTTSGAALSMNAARYRIIETQYAKDQLEENLSTILGRQYVVKSWGCPFHQSDNGLMDALHTAGYVIARGKGGFKDHNSWDLSALAIYATYYNSLDTFADLTVLNESKTAGTLMYHATMGGVFSLTIHDSEFSANDEYATLLSNLVQRFNETPGMSIKSLAEIGDLVTENGVKTGSAGNEIRYAYPQGTIPDVSLLPTSPCIDAGVTISGVNDAGQLDLFGYAVLGRPNIGASQQYGRQAKGTLSFIWTPGFNKADVTGTLNIISFDGSTSHVRYNATAGQLELYDGTNTATVALDCVANTAYAVKSTWEGSNMRLWVNTTAGTMSTFDGSFNPGTNVVFGLNNNELQYIKDIKVLKTPNWETPI